MSPEICLIEPAHVIMVFLYYWLLKISEDTFYEVDESANNKEIPIAGREAAKNKLVSAAHRVVRMKALRPMPVLSRDSPCLASKCS